METRRLIIGAIATAGLAAGIDAAYSALKEKRLIADKGLTAIVEDRPDWCGAVVDVAIRSDRIEEFRGDRRQLQVMLGQVRAILSLECEQTTRIRITGLVKDTFVYDGVATKESNWVLLEIPAALTQEYIDDPALAPAPAPASPPQAAAPPPAAPPAATTPLAPTPPPAAPPTSNSQAAAAAEWSEPALSPAITECDRRAAHPDDPEKPDDIAGVSDSAIDAASAIVPCRAAVSADPEEPRLKFQLARAYLFADQPAEAIDLLIEAAEEDHGAALAYLGDIILYGALGIDSKPDVAKSLYLRAAQEGFKPAAALAADIVADAIPAAQSAGQAAADYYLPDYMNPMQAGREPDIGTIRTQMRAQSLPPNAAPGAMLFYAMYALTGIREHCPSLVPSKQDWSEAVPRAFLKRMDLAAVMAISSRKSNGDMDEFLQQAMDDGYTLATVKGCDGQNTRTFVKTSLGMFGL